MNETIHIGDAVYVHFDGYGIEFPLNHRQSPCAVYLEPETLQGVIEFWNSAQKRKELGERGSQRNTKTADPDRRGPGQSDRRFHDVSRD
jgi:hypothetical protein